MSPPEVIWGAQQSGRGWMPRPIRPGMGQADDSGHRTPHDAAHQAGRAPPQATTGRGGRVAIAGPRRSPEAGTMPAVPWTPRKRRRYHERRSVSLSRMRLPSNHVICILTDGRSLILNTMEVSVMPGMDSWCRRSVVATLSLVGLRGVEFTVKELANAESNERPGG